MARIRSIKPEFWTDEKIVECSPWARLLFIASWNFGDDHGRMEYSPKRLKLLVFPGDNVEIETLVKELSERGMLVIYEVDGHQYLQVCNFSKHQKVDHPGKSRYPAPPSFANTRESSRTLASPREVSRPLAPEKEKEKEREGEGKRNPPPPTPTNGHFDPTPEDLSPLMLARGMIETLHIPHNTTLQQQVADCIDAKARQAGMSFAEAHDHIRDRASRAGPVEKWLFWFRDAQYDVKSKADKSKQWRENFEANEAVK